MNEKFELEDGEVIEVTEEVRYVYLVGFVADETLGNSVVELDNLVRSYDDIEALQELIEAAHDVTDVIVLGFSLLRTERVVIL